MSQNRLTFRMVELDNVIDVLFMVIANFLTISGQQMYLSVSTINCKTLIGTKFHVICQTLVSTSGFAMQNLQI